MKINNENDLIQLQFINIKLINHSALHLINLGHFQMYRKTIQHVLPGHKHTATLLLQNNNFLKAISKTNVDLKAK